jgi:hypothetical protein
MKVLIDAATSTQDVAAAIRVIQSRFITNT